MAADITALVRKKLNDFKQTVGPTLQKSAEVYTAPARQLAPHLSPTNYNTPVLGGVRRLSREAFGPSFYEHAPSMNQQQFAQELAMTYGTLGGGKNAPRPQLKPVDLKPIQNTLKPLTDAGRKIVRPITQLLSHEKPLDRARIEFFKKQIAAGEDVGPLLLKREGKKFGVEDGKHRLQAYKELGKTKIPTVELTSRTPPAKGAIPAAAVALNAPKQIAPARQFLDRARNQISSQGIAGKALAEDLQKTRDLAETTAGKWEINLKNVKSLSEKDFDNFVDVAEGKAQPLSQKVALAAQEWDAVRRDIHAAAKASGLDIGFIDNYFPHRFDPKMFKGDNYRKAVEHLVKTGQATDPQDAAQKLRYAQDIIRNRRQGNLEAERLVNLPGYERTKGALIDYIESAANRISQVQVLGPEDSNALRLINQIAQEGGDADTVRNLFNIAVGAQKYGQLQQAVAGGLRKYNTVTKLGLGAVTNVGQNVNTATVTGIRRTLAALPKGAISEEAKDFALKAGITLDGVINDLREGAGFSGKVLGKISAPGFGKVERFNRTVAAWAGKGYAEDLAQQAARGSKSAIDGLRKLGLDPDTIIKRGGVLEEADQIMAARRIVERTQFKVDPQDLPGWASSPWGKVLTQFKTFSYNQTAFIGREILQPAMQGDAKPLVRFLLVALPVGAGIKETRNLLQNRDSEEDPLKRVQQYYSQAGGLGMAGDLVTGLFPQNGKYLPQDRAVSLALGTLGGPTVGTVAEGYGALTQLVQGKPTSAERFALRQVPVVGGTLQNTLLPYKIKETETQQRVADSALTSRDSLVSGGAGSVVQAGELPQPTDQTASSTGNAELDREIQSALADGIITPVEEAMLSDLKDTLKKEEKSILDKKGVNVPFLGQMGGLTDDQKNTQVTRLRTQTKAIDDALKAPEQKAKKAKDEYELYNAEYSLQSDRLKRTDNFEGYIDKTNTYIDYLKQYQSGLDPENDKKEIVSLQNRIEDLQAQAEKYISQGGFKKPKKPKKLSVGSVSRGSAPKIKSLRPRKTRLKAVSVKQPKIKMLKPKTFKAPKIKVAKGKRQ